MIRIVNICFLVICVLFSSLSQAQESSADVNNETFLSKTLGKMSVSPHVGLLHSWGDIRQDNVLPSFFQGEHNKLGYGVNLDYRITDFLSVSGGILHGSLVGKKDNVNTLGALNEPFDLGTGIQFNTELLELTLPRVDLNVTRLLFKDRVNFFNKFSLGVMASYGLVFTSSKIYAQSNQDFNLIYSKERGRTGKTTEGVISFGAKASYEISNRFDVFAEASMRNTFDDKLDAWIGGDHNDSYSYTAIGFTYRFKDKRKKSSSENEVVSNPVIDASTAVDMKPVAEESVPQTIVFGKYLYKNSPMSNVAIVVYDEDNNPIDTVMTDANGYFEYKKLNADQNLTFKPINLNELDADDVLISTMEAKSKDAIQGDFFTTDTDNPKVNTAIDTKKDMVDLADTAVYSISKNYGYFVSVAAFRGLNKAQGVADKIVKMGDTPTIIANLTNTWYLVTIERYTNKAEAIQAMMEARERGYDNAWVHIKLQ